MIPIRGRIQGLAATNSALAQIPSLIMQAGQRAMTQSLERLSQIMRTEFLSGPYPTNIQPRSGLFRASWRRGHPANIFQVRTEQLRMIGVLGSQDISGRILDEGTSYLPGGVLRPRNRKFLAIPTDLAKTPAGVLKPQYRGRSWREVPNLFVGRARSGVLYLAERSPATGRQRRSGLRVLAWLVRSVKIVGRQFTQKAAARATPDITQIFQQTLQTILERANRTLRGR